MDSDPQIRMPILLITMHRTSSIQDSLSLFGTGSQIISFYPVREGLVPWDWLFLEWKKLSQSETSELQAATPKQQAEDVEGRY